MCTAPDSCHSVRAGTYNLTLSQPLGAGPYGTRPCAFTCATTPLQPPPVTVNIPRTEHISSISVSYASSVSGVPVPAAVCGIKVELWDGNDSPTQSGSEQVAGAASSEGWLTLQLGPGEAVTGVGGCAGGFLERLVLHTDSGRAWTAPWTGQSPCSTPFHVQAPPGGKLVGVQVGLPWPACAPAARATFLGSWVASHGCLVQRVVIQLL